MFGGVSLQRWSGLLAAGVLAALGWCGVGAERAWASTQTYTTPGSYSFTVPAGVTSIAVTAIGGAGGDCIVVPSGGEGASVAATVPVAPGEQLVVWVAGAGNACDDGGGGGFGGGAAGGTGTGGTRDLGGGGGGASVVAPGTSSPDFSRALVVAAGGGGASNGIQVINGGNAGSPGTDDDDGVPGSGGGAGAQSAGGAGGVAEDSNATAGTAGSLGAGGAGGDGDPGATSAGGGGGGGGYYGGGGGGGSGASENGGGGGGGSSFVAVGATNVTGPMPTSSAPEVTITYTPTSTSLSAPPSGVEGTAIPAGSVSATLSGASAGASGTITFTVFGPQSSPPTDCTSGGTTVGTATVSGAGTYNPSAGYIPPAAGTYYWYAAYSGAAANEPSNSGCGTGMASTVVSPVAVSRLSASPHRLSIAGRKVHGKCVTPTRKNTADKHCERPVKLTVAYTLNAGATVTFTVKVKSTGRKVKGKCVAQTTHNKHKPRCTRLVNVGGKVVKTGSSGANRFVWNGKIGGHELAPGSYELTATLADGASQTVAFTIVG